MRRQQYNICVISFYYPPAQNARAFRWGSIVKQLREEGHHVDVICPSFKKNEVKNAPISKVANKISLMARLKSFLWLYAWPDLPIIWVPKALVAFFTLKNKPDVLITVAMPFSTHVAGLILKRIFPRQPWIADIGDPISLVENDKRLYPLLDKALEALIVKKADAISVTTLSLQTAYGSWLEQEAREKIKYIPPLMPDIKYLFLGNIKNPDNVLTVGFFGTLYGKIRNPSWCFQLLTRLSKRFTMKLYIVGLLHECENEINDLTSSFSGEVTIMGPKSRDEIFKLYDEMDFLINIGNSNVYQLPSKVIEYLWTGKPILNFCSSKADSSFEMFQKLKVENVINIFEENNLKNEEMLIREIHQKRQTVVSDEKRRTILEPFSLKNVTREYIETVSSVAKKYEAYR